MAPKNAHRWDKLSEANGRVSWSCQRCGCKVDAPGGKKPSDLVSNRVVNGERKRARQPLPTCLDDTGRPAERQRRAALRHSWQASSPVEFDGRTWGGWSCRICAMEMITGRRDTYAGATRRYRLAPGDDWTVATGLPIPQCSEPPENALLREHYIKSGAAYCAKALGRSVKYVGVMARRIGIQRPKPQRMSEQHASYLQFKWGVDSAEVIAKALGYDVSVVIKEAQRLRLGRLCPRGWEYLTASSKRTGFATTVLRRIVKNACINLKVIKVGGGRRYIVEIDRVDKAIEKWFELDNPGSFAARNSMELWQFEVWLEKLGVTRPKGIGPRKWMVPSSTLNKALKMRGSHESVGAFARRMGLQQAQMEGYLLALGHERPARGSRQQWRLPVSVMKRALKDYPRLESPTAWAHRHGLGVEAVLRELRQAGLKPQRDGGRMRFMPEVIDKVMAQAEKRKEALLDYTTPYVYAKTHGHSPSWLRGMLVAAGHKAPPAGVPWKLPRSVIEQAVVGDKAQTTPTAFARQRRCKPEKVKMALLAAGHKPPMSNITPWRLPVAAFEAAMAA